MEYTKNVDGKVLPCTPKEIIDIQQREKIYVEEQVELAKTKYQRDRAEAYPSLEEQADMAYWDRQNGTTTLDDAISAVKAQYPKP